MRKRIVSIITWVLILGIIISLLVMNIFYNSHFTTEMRTNMISLVTIIREDLSDNNDTSEQALVNLSKETNSLHITIISAQGQILVSSDSNDMQLQKNLLQQDDIKQANVAGIGTSIETFEKTGRKMMCVAGKLDNGNFVQVARDYKGYWQELFTSLPTLIVSLALGTLIALFVGYQLTKRAVYPVRQFAGDVEKSARKKTALNPDDYPYVELQSMAFGWNRIYNKLQRISKRRKMDYKRIFAVANAMQEGFIMLDNDENIILINESACNILGCDNSVRGQSILHATRLMPLVEGVQTVFKDKNSVDIDIVSEQGRPIDVSIHSSKEGVTVLLLEEEVGDDAKKARQQFFQSASDELLTPIESIKTLTQKLQKEEGLMPEEQKKNIDKLANKVDNLSFLIEDMIQINEIENGTISKEKVEIDFGGVVENSYYNRKEMASKRDISLDCSVEPSFVYADERDLYQMADNLISNAIKYNYTGGEVSIKLYHQGGRILLRVFNTGVAILPEDTGRIFERFSRIKQDGENEGVEGTGLGLSIVKHLASQYGGGVSVIPQPGVGNTFIISLPLNKQNKNKKS